jgi:hypothetical protein
MSLSLSSEIEDSDWGCCYQTVIDALGGTGIKVCLVKVKNLNEFAVRITNLVLDNSWMTALDHGTRRAYETTVGETAHALVQIFKQTTVQGTVGSEFGEVMVSIGSARALEQIFKHVSIPIAELWKPQKKQNEGFDFHTICSSDHINFGEAKFSGSTSPHGLAISQSDQFVSAKKHLRDRVHLVNLASKKSIENLDQDNFGVIASFSLNTKNPLTIFKNAIESAAQVAASQKITNFYLVGVSDEC